MTRSRMRFLRELVLNLFHSSFHAIYQYLILFDRNVSPLLKKCTNFYYLFKSHLARHLILQENYSVNLCHFAGKYEQVVLMGTEGHARCSWCGTTVDIGLTSSSFNDNIYCSGECKDAGELKNWVCISGVVVPITIFAWVSAFVFGSAYGVVDILLPYLLLFSIFSLLLLILVYKGIKARKRIHRNSRFRMS